MSGKIYLQRNTRLVVVGVLLILVLLISTWVTVTVSRVRHLRDIKVPALRKAYEEVHANLSRISIRIHDGGRDVVEKGGAPSVAQFRELAKIAGISRIPTFDQRNQNSRSKSVKEVLTKIYAPDITAESLYAFLQSVENLSNSGRIKELTISPAGKKQDTFNLNVSYSTYSALGRN